jgi:hypothetical protein
MRWFCHRRHKIHSVKITLRFPGAIIMATAVSVLDTHVPLQLGVQYLNAAGKAVNAPAAAVPVFAVSDASLATQVQSGFADVVTLTQADGSFSVSYNDGVFSDTLPVTVTPDQTPASVQIVFQNP